MLSPREYTAWAGLLHVHATLLRQLDAELQAAHGLPLSVYEVLVFLAHAPEQRMRMSDLARGVVLSLSGVSRLIDRLERDGLVCRRRAEEDLRGNYVMLTDSGRERFIAAHATHLAGVRRLFLERLETDDLDVLSGYWERLVPGTATAIRTVPRDDEAPAAR